MIRVHLTSPLLSPQGHTPSSPFSTPPPSLTPLLGSTLSYVGARRVERRLEVLGVHDRGGDVVPARDVARPGLVHVGGAARVERDVLQLLDHLVDVLPVAELARHAHVGRALVHVSLQRRGQLLRVEGGPVEVGEEGRALDVARAWRREEAPIQPSLPRRGEGGARGCVVPRAVRPVAAALGRLLDEEGVDELEQAGGLPVRALLGVRVSAVAVEDELAEGEPVDALLVRLLRLHLGRHVPLRAADGLAAARLRVELGRHPHVDHPQVPLGVDEDVGGLEVAVHDGLLVHVRERAHELPRHEADLLLPHRLALVLLEVARERVVGHVLLHHVQELRRLEGVVDRNHVRVVARLEALELARGVQLPAAGAGGEDLLVEHL
mmetsp:Transcript_15236/g.45277  ORF Transcript_15236/g.45277 Transcript_15236/m.45277 type:complete len:379 (-) Transcript_15236:2214-3350(-)